jgi:hypothetical protein
LLELLWAQGQIGLQTRHGGNAMSDQLDDQPASDLQLLMTIGVEGFRELVAWVADGDTAEARHARGLKANRAITEVLKDVDRAKINESLHAAAEELKENAAVVAVGDNGSGR